MNKIIIALLILVVIWVNIFSIDASDSNLSMVTLKGLEAIACESISEIGSVQRSNFSETGTYTVSVSKHTLPSYYSGGYIMQVFPCLTCSNYQSGSSWTINNNSSSGSSFSSSGGTSGMSGSFGGTNQSGSSVSVNFSNCSMGSSCEYSSNGSLRTCTSAPC